MKKIIAKHYNDLMVYDDILNSVEEISNIGLYTTLYKMKDDGEIITKDEVIPYTKDCYLLSVGGGPNNNRWVVIDDKATVFDIDGAIDAFEKIQSKNNCCEPKEIQL